MKSHLAVVSALLFTFVPSTMPLEGQQARPWTLRDVGMGGGNFYVRNPVFVNASLATFLEDDDRVIGVEGEGVAKAYPAAVAIWHHGIEDRLGAVPLFVTWCNECNTSMVYRAEADGRPLMFFHTNMVRQNMTFADRETRTRWQQQTGEAIEGPLKGRRLEVYPFVLTSWSEWRARHPQTLVMEPIPGFEELYDIWVKVIEWRRPGRAEGAVARRVQREDNRLPAYEPVVGLEAGGARRGYPRLLLKEEIVVNDRLGAEDVLVLYNGKADAVTAFSRTLEGRTLRFERQPSGDLLDVDTRSRWNTYGECVGGRLEGQRLRGLLVVPQFWWAWSVFYPDTDVYTGRGTRPTTNE
jgi:hypothetical protein